MPRPEPAVLTRPAEAGGWVSLRFDAIGAPWEITTREPLDPALVALIHERIACFDAVYSRFRTDSLVSRIAQDPGTYVFPDDAAPLFDLYRTLHRATGGGVSPLVGRRLEHLGYDRSYSFRVSSDPAAVPVWDDSTAVWDGRALTTRQPVLVDVGAAGKGYLVDLVAGLLDAAGVAEYVVDASGDLLHRGDEPVRIALEHPFDPSLAVGVVELVGGALCASAPNRRAWGAGLHHIIDARTGLPTTDVVATWALAPTALLADGLATALFFAGPVELAAAFEAAGPVETVAVRSDGLLTASPSFSGDLFS
jgi:thiamine biosynthesis lipoprotein